MTPTLLVDIIVGGLITGGVFAPRALGLNLQYGLMRVLNVAHGEFLMMGAYLTYSLHTAWGVNPLLTLLITGPASFGAGLVLHRLLYARVLAGEAAEALGARPPPLPLRARAGRRGRRGARVPLPPTVLRSPLRPPERGAPPLERGSEGLQLPRGPPALPRIGLPRQPARGRSGGARGEPRLLRLPPAELPRQGDPRPDAGSRGRAAGGGQPVPGPRPLLRDRHRHVGGHRLADQHALRADPVHRPSLHRDGPRRRHPGRPRQRRRQPPGRADPGPGGDGERLSGRPRP